MVQPKLRNSEYLKLQDTSSLLVTGISTLAVGPEEAHRGSHGHPLLSWTTEGPLKVGAQPLGPPQTAPMEAQHCWKGALSKTL